MANRYPLVANASSLVIEEIQSSDTVVIDNLSVSTTANLGAVGNITITGGSSGQVLKTNGSGVLSWGADSTAAGGNTTEVQYNNASSLAGATTFTFTSGTSTLAVGNITTTHTIAGTGNVSGGNLTTSGLIQATGNITGGNLSCLPSGTVFTVNANASGNLNLNGSASSINFKAQDGGNTAVLQAPAAIAGGLIGWSLPNTQGNVGEFLTNTGGSGQEMEWKTVATSTAPSTSGSAGQAGQVAYDASYMYICVDTNTWKRAPIATW